MGSLLSALKSKPTPPPSPYDPYHNRNSFSTATPSVPNYRPSVTTHPSSSQSSVPIYRPSVTTRPTSSQYNSGTASNTRLTTTTSQISSDGRKLYSTHLRETLSHQVNFNQTRVVESIVSNLPLMPRIYGEPDAAKWNRNDLPHNKSFRLVNVMEHEQDFILVSTDFQNGARGKNFKIVKIERVENPFLLGSYILKKEEMMRRPYKLTEGKYFHGTKKCNVDGICENNFNWRLHGGSTGSRYGKGVSFSPISYYASHYSDKNDTDKVMFYVKALVSNTIEGKENMVLPPKLRGVSNMWYDTAIKPDGHVVVKFCDNEFYPEFIIHYCISATSAYRRQSNRYSDSRDLCCDSDYSDDSDDYQYYDYYY